MATRRTESDKPVVSPTSAPGQPARDSARTDNQVLSDTLSPTTMPTNPERELSSPFWGTTEADESREARIARAAYRKAEQRDFAPGGELEDWLSAEREIDEARDGN
jgi:Protein of unknown function (DUF2934)